jgi:hypothetical protein
VIVNNLNVGWTFDRPNKAHPKLIVDSDRVLSFAIACHRLQTIAWWRPQVAEGRRGVEIAQFPAGHLDQVGRKPSRGFSVKHGLGGLVPETSDNE